MKGFGLLLAFLAGSTSLFAQKEDYPRDYFRNPLGIPIQLAGGYGECRPNHFHTGLDLKTQGKENLKVMAAADGYVSRIAISHKGYGHALYIAHPNGYTTVYAHLNSYYPELEAYVEKEQYRQQRWNIDIKIPSGMFPVRKGQWVANSGNTGGSTAPHVHFEIRDTKSEHVLNPTLFGLPVVDKRAPVFRKLALYDGLQSLYRQSPQIVSVKGAGNVYAPAAKELVVHSPMLMVGTDVIDYSSNSANWMGVYRLQLMIDDENAGTITVNDIDFALGRYVNAFFDYRYYTNHNSYLIGLYRLSNNPLPFYTGFANNGYVDISDGRPHKISVIAYDASGNHSRLDFSVVFKDNGNILKALCDNIAGPEASYPYPGPLKDVDFTMDRGTVYDKVCVMVAADSRKDALSREYTLVNKDIPVQKSFTLKIKPAAPVPLSLRSKLVFVHHVQAASLPGNNPQDAQLAKWDNGWVISDIRTFGTYYVAVDTIAPAIIPLQSGRNFKGRKSISFRVKENYTDIDRFRGEIDGHWVMFSRRENAFTYVFDSHCTAGKHTLKVTVSDDNDNAGTYHLEFEN